MTLPIYLGGPCLCMEHRAPLVIGPLLCHRGSVNEVWHIRVGTWEQK